MRSNQYFYSLDNMLRNESDSRDRYVSTTMVIGGSKGVPPPPPPHTQRPKMFSISQFHAVFLFFLKFWQYCMLRPPGRSAPPPMGNPGSTPDHCLVDHFNFTDIGAQALLLMHFISCRIMNNYITWSVLRTYARFLSWDYIKARYEHYEDLTGRSEFPATWHSCLSLVKSRFGLALSSLYALRHVGTDAKKEVHTK